MKGLKSEWSGWPSVMYKVLMVDIINVLLIMVTMSDRHLLSSSMFSPVSCNYGNYYNGVAMDYTHTIGLPRVCLTLSFNTTRPAVFGVLGKPLLLNCTVPGSQDLVFSWNDADASPAMTLELPSYSDNDSGTYSCSVRSQYDCGHELVPAAHFNVLTAGKCVIVRRLCTISVVW